MATVTVDNIAITNFVDPGNVSLPDVAAPVVSRSYAATTLLQAQYRGRFVRPPKLLTSATKTRNPADCVGMFGDLFWFEHVHIIPRSFDFGNILSTQTRSFEIYNGYRTTNRRISSITETSVDGLDITQPSDSPLLLRYQSSYVISLQVNLDGPVSADGSITYTFESGETLTVSFTGRRVVMLSLVPQVPMTENIEWRTDVIESYSGREQRIATRDVPRQEWRAGYIADDQTMSWLENQIFGWQGNVWGFPVWSDYCELTADATAGDTVLNITSTANKDFRADDDGGTELAIVWSAYNNFETVEVGSVGANTLTLRTGKTLLSGWSEGAYVIPVRLARMRAMPSFNNYLADNKFVQLSLTVLQNAATESVTPYTTETYLTLPVFSDYLLAPGRRYQVRYNKAVIPFQSEVGKPTSRGFRDFPEVSFSSLQLSADDRAGYVAIKNFIASRRGRQKAFWISSGRIDFTIRADQSAPATTLRVNEVNYGLQVGVSQGRAHIEILYVDGTVDRRQITAVAVTEGVGEDLTIAASTQDLSVANVERISFLHKVRFADDGFSFRHFWYDGHNEVDVGLVEVFQ